MIPVTNSKAYPSTQVQRMLKVSFKSAMILSVNISYLAKCNSCCKQSHGKLGEGSAWMSIHIHSFAAVQLSYCFAFPTSTWISSMGVSGTVPFCRCGKIQKLQIHEINLLGDLPLNNTWVYGLFGFVIDHNLDLELFASLVGRGVNLLPLGASSLAAAHLCGMLRAWQERVLQGFLAPASCDWGFKEVPGVLYFSFSFCFHHTSGSDRYINYNFYHVIVYSTKISNYEHIRRSGLTFSAFLHIDIHYFFIGNIKSFQLKS